MKKHLLFLFFCLTLLLGLLLSAVPALAAENVIFLSDGAKGDGSSAASPLKPTTGNFDKSQAAPPQQKDTALYQAVLKLIERGGGTIVFCGPYTLDETTGQGSGSAKDLMFDFKYYHPEITITYTSVWDGVDYREKNGAMLILNTQAHYVSPTASVWKNLTVGIGATERTICCGGNKALFGEGFTSCPIDKSNEGNSEFYLNVCGGERYRKLEVGTTDVTVDIGDGILGGVFGGQSGAGVNYPLTANTSVKIKSGTVLGDVGGGSRLSSTPVDGSSKVLIEGGVFRGTVSAAGQGGFLTETRKATLTITGGDFSACRGIVDLASGVSGFLPKESLLDYSSVDEETAFQIHRVASLFTEIRAAEFSFEDFIREESTTDPAGPGEEAIPELPERISFVRISTLTAFLLFVFAVLLFVLIGRGVSSLRRRKKN